MARSTDDDPRLSSDGVLADLQRQPQLLMRLAENALTVAESLRDNYFKNTSKFVKELRRAVSKADRTYPILEIHKVDHVAWPEFGGEVVTFIDGGIGSVRISGRVPILLRVGSYCVRVGERRMAEREQFGYYPIILGDLEGGSKGRKDFTDIVRITAELLGGLAALERTPDLRVLMFHGPLVYSVWHYMGHTPFTEQDIDRFLLQYAATPESGRALKEDFLREAKVEIYPLMTNRSDEWARKRVFEPLAWISFLYRRLIEIARRRDPPPLIAGVVERGGSKEFSERILLPRVFRGMRQKGKEDWFNEMYGRTDLTSPAALLEKLGYSDALLLAMLLEPGQYSESWDMAGKYEKLAQVNVSLPGEAGTTPVDYTPLKPGPIGFPQIKGCYLMASETTEPIRIEVFGDLGSEQVGEAAKRAYLYSRLLPGYGFPVGLDVADKFAKVPSWLTDAYGKLIRHHLGVSLQQGEISDSEMRRILVQAIYITHRDWLFRPEV